MNSHYYGNSYNQMNSRHYIRIHTSYEFKLCWRSSLFVGVIFFFTFGAVNVAEQSCSSLNLYWCALRYARKIFCSFPALLAAPLFDGGSHCQGSWIAASDNSWIHVSTWMQASLQRRAKESVGHLNWTPWWLPLVVLGSPFETCFCMVIIVKALLSNNIILFGKTNVLETLTYKVEQWWTVFRESKEVLGLKSCLIGRNMSGIIQMAMLCTKYMAFQKNIRV